MKIYNKTDPVIREINGLKKRGMTIGFVPTMGALHKGHLSLLHRAREANHIVAASIFINPLQFNDKRDLVNYPRTIDEDIEQLESAGCDLLYAPSEEEIYRGHKQIIYDFGHLGNIMEGRFRKGHFNGVATVVHKLFEIIKPDRAYFGEKDFQQLVIVNKLTQDYALPVEIISCPTIREDDGLALSSRNRLLTKKQRKDASLIPDVLFEARDKALYMSVDEIREWVINRISSNKEFDLEYFEIVDSVELKEITKWSEQKQKVGCIAVKVGDVRLIDNILF